MVCLTHWSLVSGWSTRAYRRGPNPQTINPAPLIPNPSPEIITPKMRHWSVSRCAPRSSNRQPHGGSSLIRNRHPLLAPPSQPKHGPAVGSCGVAVSYTRGSPVHPTTRALTTKPETPNPKPQPPNLRSLVQFLSCSKRDDVFGTELLRGWSRSSRFNRGQRDQFFTVT